MSNGDGCDTPRLSTGNHARHPSASLEAHLGNLGALAASGLSGYDDNRVILDGLYDLGRTSTYRQLFGKRNARHEPGTEPLFLDRSNQLFFQIFQLMQNLVFFCATIDSVEAGSVCVLHRTDPSTVRSANEHESCL